MTRPGRRFNAGNAENAGNAGNAENAENAENDGNDGSDGSDALWLRLTVWLVSVFASLRHRIVDPMSKYGAV